MHFDVCTCVCCAVALTVYFAAQYMVLNYVRKLSTAWGTGGPT